MFSLDTFRNPPDDYRGTDFWMLNDKLDDDELRRQLHSMRGQGVASVIARTYIGLKSDYPGADFKHKMRVIVETAREVGIRIFLQACYMPEAVLGLPPEFALANLMPLAGDEAQNAVREGRGRILATAGGYAYTAVNTGTFLDMLDREAVAFYLERSYGEMWREFADEFGKTCVSVWVDEPSYSPRGLPWSRSLPGAFRRQWGYDLEPEAEALFRDVPNCATVRYHYWRIVRELLEHSYFVQVRDWCHAHGLLFSGHLMMEETLGSQLLRAGATMPYYKYFDIPGIDVLTGETNWRFNPLPRRTPGVNFSQGLYSTPLQCASAANQAGRERVLAEMYGVTSENFGLREQKHMFDHFAALGINHRSVHGIFYSLRGRAKRAFPPHVSDYQPYWKHYALLTDYVARVSYFVRQGTAVRDVAVLHPLPSATCEWRGPGSPDGRGSDELDRREHAFLDLEVQLVATHCAFDLLDESTLAMWGETRAGNGAEPRLQVGKAAYTTVVMPDLKAIAGSTLEKLEHFAQSGGRVLAIGGLPTLLDGIPEPALAERLAFVQVLPGNDDLVTLLAALPRAFRLSADSDVTEVMGNHRRDAGSGTDYFFLFNRDCREQRHVSLTVHGARRAVLLPADGQGEPAPLPATTSADTTTIRITLPEGGSAMVIVSEGQAAAGERQVTHGGRSTLLHLDSAWSVRRCDPNVLLLEFARYRTGHGEFGKDYPILAIHDRLIRQDYHGPLTLRLEINAARDFGGCKLALEDAACQRIVLNGKPVATRIDGHYLCRSFETVPLDVPLKQGLNILEVSRDYVPLSRMRSGITSLFETQSGVELEPMYLIGDFAVRSRRKPTRAAAIRMSRDMTLADEPEIVHGELVDAGYPFFAGTIALEQAINVPAEFLEEGGATPVLELEGVRACHVRVILNGEAQGDVAWYPYSVPLRGLRAGRNLLRLELTNTIRNVIGPYHRPKGEYGEAWGGGYNAPNLAWLGAVAEVTNKEIADWEERRVPDTSAWVEDYMLVSFGVSDVRIRRQDKFWILDL